MTTEPLTKAARLAIGGAVAPVVRRQAAAPRKVTVVDKDGKPVRETTHVEVAKAVLARSEIEFSVQEGKRPEYTACKTCGSPIKVSQYGKPRTVCRSGTHKCQCGEPVRTNGCGYGKSCASCANQLGADRLRSLPKEARSAIARRNAQAQWAKMTPEERSKKAQKRAAETPADVRRSAARAGAKAALDRLTPEQIAQRCERMRANVDAEKRKKGFRQAIALLTPEQRLERVQKAVAGRRAAAAARRAAKSAT